MKEVILCFILVVLCFQKAFGQHKNGGINPDTLKIESHVKNLRIALLHESPSSISADYPVLFLHGSSFPSGLAFGFKMNGYSWMNNLTEHGFEVFALDFLGYGNSDRYPEMKSLIFTGTVGRALEVYLDVGKAVNFIIKKTGKAKVYLIGHSWGGSVAALYASKFPDKVEKLVLFAAITARQDQTDRTIIHTPKESLTPGQRIMAMQSLTPANKESRLENEVLKAWGVTWLQSDPLSRINNSDSVHFPSGPSQDVEDLQHNLPYYNPSDIRVPVLLVRGEWDKYPNSNDAETLFSALENSPGKKLVTIEKGTHVMHLEKSRYQLYNETLFFLNNNTNGMKINNHQVAVIFEVIPAKGQKQNYLDLAKNLRAQLDSIDGFVSIERFESLYTPGKILSLSFWRDEEAVTRWRNLEEHRKAQEKGRSGIFENYRLRVASVIRDYGMFDRNEAPMDSKKRHSQ